MSTVAELEKKREKLIKESVAIIDKGGEVPSSIQNQINAINRKLQEIRGKDFMDKYKHFPKPPKIPKKKFKENRKKYKSSSSSSSESKKPKPESENNFYAVWHDSPKEKKKKEKKNKEEKTEKKSTSGDCTVKVKAYCRRKPKKTQKTS